MTTIPVYIQDRLRTPPPAEMYVVPGSTPVLSFGPARSAVVATLGLNPSRKEFLDRDGRELTGPLRWLATHTSIGTSDLSNASVEVLAQILNDCDTYFQ